MGNKNQSSNIVEISEYNGIRRRKRMLAYAKGCRNIRRARECAKK